MKTQIAVRNLRLCTKDCLCLYVCPTGASDTENSIIDTEKCVGCGVCAKACPSGAISMVPVEYPPQQKKEKEVLEVSFALSKNKAKQEKIALQLARSAEDDGLYRLMTAAAKSVRLVNEDLLRESGYMLPQSGNTHKILREWIENPPTADFPAEAAGKLLELLPDNDQIAPDSGEITPSDGHATPDSGQDEKKTAATYRCRVCGHVFSVPEGEEPVCPVCKASGDSLERIG